MSDLRVDTHAIESSYLVTPSSKDVWNVSAVWSDHAIDGARLRSSKKTVTTLDGAGPAVERVVNGVIAVFQAQTMRDHREAVELFSQSLLWDGPPIRLSNKGHLRLATYLFKYFAHLSITPVGVVLSQPGPGRHLIELDAVAVSRPHRVWWLPATLLLPAEIPKNVHFKIGVKGSLEDGQVELFTGRLTNLPPFAIEPARVIAGIFMGALPHAFEEVLGFFFDWADNSSYYAEKRNATFKSRHPDSTNPTWDYAQDVFYDTQGWAQQQAVVAYETAQAAFGKTFNNVNQTLQAIISFYAWLLSSIWSLISSATNTASDLLGASGAPAEAFPTPAGGGAKVYKGKTPMTASTVVPGRS